MRPLGVVLLLPRLDDGAGMRQTAEPVQIQALIAKPAVEALDMGVLRGLAGVNEISRHAMCIGPSVQDAPSKLWTIVHANPFGRAKGAHELVEDTRDAWAWERGVDFQHQALTSHPIEQIQRAKTASIDEHVLHEVHTPGFSPFPDLLL